MSFVIYTNPVAEFGIEAFSWSAGTVPSAPTRHALSNDQRSFTAASGITSSTRLTLRYSAVDSPPSNAFFFRWNDGCSDTITRVRLFVENQEAPGEFEVSYSTAVGDGGLAVSGIYANYGYDMGGWVLAEYTEVGQTNNLIKMGFIGSGTFYLNSFFPLHTLNIYEPVYATQHDFWVEGTDAERTLSGKLRISSKGLTIKSRFTIVYELLRTSQKDSVLDLYNNSRGGMFPFAVRFNNNVFMVRFSSAPLVVEEAAGLFNLSLDLEEI